MPRTTVANAPAHQKSLSPRKAPVQERSKTTIQRILDAAASLLDEAGIDALTTNGIATRAGVNIASLYNYFPNKYAVVAALAQRLAEREFSLFQALEARFLNDWRDAVDQGIDALVDSMREQTGIAAIRRAVQATPYLRQFDQQANAIIAEEYAALLRRAGLRIPKRRLQAAARSLTETFTVVVDLALTDDGDYSAELIEELKLMHKSYLANYLE